jgi:hypothetical protein
MTMKTLKRQFKTGHIYSILYDDHFSVDRSYREEEDAKPAQLRQRGMCLMESDTVVILEHNLHVSDRHATNKRSDRNGILKSCIRSVQDFGPEK